MEKDGKLACQILELSEHASYVFAKDDFHILYANAKAKEIFGEKMEQCTCYQSIEGKQLPCIDCPFVTKRSDKNYLLERYVEAFDRKVKVKAKEMTWENGQQVVVCMVLDSDLLLEEKLRSDKRANAAYAELKYRTEYDALTKIPNVHQFYVNAGQRVRERNEQKNAIISFDIDNFKMINDLFGMEAGDDVLKHIAAVLKDKLPTDALYCRVHSDMFLICTYYEKRGELIKLIEKLRKAIYRNQFSFDINTSFGIYLVQDTLIPINLMCDRAVLAERTIKGNAMRFCAFYDEQYRNEIVKTTEIEQDMNRAILDKQFVMYLQPKYELTTGKICGAEVLARWKHPTKGIIQPNDFIPLFERNGFILRLDEYMWEQACQTLASWRAEGKTPVPLSVNISRYHIRYNDLVGVWKRLIKEYKISTSDLTLEITETFFENSADLYSVLSELQDLGFRLEVDDFGAGYSSLNLIRQIPVNTIKIDKDFLDQKLTTEKGKIVISHTIAMAKELELGVVAEGVETKEHVDFLKSSHCDIAQGYYFAKPMPLEEFNQLLFGNK